MTIIRIHNITAKPTLKCSSEAWVFKKKVIERHEAAQVKFLWPLLGIMKLDHQQNTSRKKLNVWNVIIETEDYQKDWI